jgi:chromosomal replication initiator protein
MAQGDPKLTTPCAVTAALSETLQRALLERITAPRYDLWFKDKTTFSFDGDRLVVGVSNLHYQDWLQKKFAGDVEAAAREVAGDDVRVCFVIQPQLFQSTRQAPASSASQSATVTQTPVEAKVAEPMPRAARRFKRLADFVIGSCNRVAHAAALGVVEEPGLVPIPLVLHGPVGSGKSHLLDGIHAELREKYADARVLHLTAEEFTNRFLAAMHQNKQPSFRRQFRECDVLLIDDLQFLAKKTATQVEFLHTLETLQRDGRTVVVTCDCHPRLAGVFGPELTDRLVGGAVHGLAWPDPATRRMLLQVKTLGRGAFPPTVLDLLSQQLRGNVRELEGAIHSVVHHARVTGRTIDAELAREALAEVLRSSVRTVELSDIDRAVTTTLEMPTGTLQSPKRTQQISGARMVAMYLARKHTSATYSEIGQHFGQRNHSTAVAAEKRVRLWLAENARVALGKTKTPVGEMIERIEGELAR